MQLHTSNSIDWCVYQMSNKSLLQFVVCKEAKCNAIQLTLDWSKVYVYAMLFWSIGY